MKCPQSANTFKMLTGLLLGLLMTIFFTSVQAAPDDDLGRLFSKPNERNNLDNLRQNQKLKIVSPQDDPLPDPMAEAAPPELPDPITMQGYVKRGDGEKSTLWINNQAVQEDSTVGNVKIGRLNQSGFSKQGASIEGVDVKIPANGKHIRLKAGQVYEPETNQIKELKSVEKEKKLGLEETGVIDDEKTLR